MDSTQWVLQSMGLRNNLLWDTSAIKPMSSDEHQRIIPFRPPTSAPRTFVI